MLVNEIARPGFGEVAAVEKFLGAVKTEVHAYGELLEQHARLDFVEADVFALTRSKDARSVCAVGESREALGSCCVGSSSPIANASTTGDVPTAIEAACLNAFADIPESKLSI